MSCNYLAGKSQKIGEMFLNIYMHIIQYILPANGEMG